MNNPLAPRIMLRLDGRRRFAAENLKRCPLCGAVNARQNEECFQCSWTGEFDYEIDSVQEGLEELMEQCPEIAELLVDPETIWDRLFATARQLWRRVTRRRINFTA